MINTAIDYALNATIFTAIAYFGFCLIASLGACLQAKKDGYAVLHQNLQQAVVEPAKAPTVIDPDNDEFLSTLNLFPDFSSMTVTELRKMCSDMGIVWRNAYGKNKHLKKGEMIALILG